MSEFSEKGDFKGDSLGSIQIWYLEERASAGTDASSMNRDSGTDSESSTIPEKK